jgi:hypothetical protein
MTHVSLRIKGQVTINQPLEKIKARWLAAGRPSGWSICFSGKNQWFELHDVFRDAGAAASRHVAAKQSLISKETWQGLGFGVIAIVVMGMWTMCSNESSPPPQRPAVDSLSPSHSPKGDNESFKQWALKNTAVTDIAINGPSMFVTLSSDKYTTKENVSAIARDLARYYCIQTGASYMNCHIYLGDKEYASGSFSK